MSRTKKAAAIATLFTALTAATGTMAQDSPASHVESCMLGNRFGILTLQNGTYDLKLKQTNANGEQETIYHLVRGQSEEMHTYLSYVINAYCNDGTVPARFHIRHPEHKR